MPEENKTKLNLETDISQESLDKVTDGLSDAIIGAVDNKKTKSKFEELFTGKNVKKTFSNNFSKMFSSSEKSQQKQNKLAQSFLKHQQSINKLVGTQGKGFKGNAKLVGLMGKQAMTGLSGIASKMNPVMLAVTAAIEGIKILANQMQRVAEESSKFVGQGSLFTDKATMNMMQMTGQTSTQAQGTNRSLQMLGLDFSDIQSGKITAEQAAAFEAIRQRELDKLEQIDKIAGPMMKSLQQVTLGFSLLMQDVNDWITMAMGETAGIEKLIGSIKGFLAGLGPFIKSIIGTIAPVFGVLADVLGVIIDIVNAIIIAITPLFDLIQAPLRFIATAVSVIARIAGPLVVGLGRFIGLFFKLLSAFDLAGPLLNLLSDYLEKFMGALDWVSEGVSWLVGGFAELINSIIGAVKTIKIGKWEPFSDLDYIDIDGVKSTVSNPGSTYNNQSTNNYIYGSSNTQNNQNSNTDLFSNGYVLVND